MIFSKSSRPDVAKCGTCSSVLLQEVVPFSGGLASLYCVTCKTREVVVPRRPPPEPVVPVRETVVEDYCVICSIQISTTIRRGSGTRITMCDGHSAAEKNAWTDLWDGKCLAGDCDAEATARGRCNRHYSRWWRAELKKKSKAEMEARNLAVSEDDSDNQRVA